MPAYFRSQGNQPLRAQEPPPPGRRGCAGPRRRSGGRALTRPCASPGKVGSGSEAVDAECSPRGPRHGRWVRGQPLRRTQGPGPAGRCGSEPGCVAGAAAALGRPALLAGWGGRSEALSGARDSPALLLHLPAGVVSPGNGRVSAPRPPARRSGNSHHSMAGKGQPASRLPVGLGVSIPPPRKEASTHGCICHGRGNPRSSEAPPKAPGLTPAPWPAAWSTADERPPTIHTLSPISITPCPQVMGGGGVIPGT